MKIVRLTASNFRALEQVALTKAAKVNVIVGPNAVGKSTLLDVIRLPKSVLIPRINNEGQQALIGLGVLNPHNPSIGGPGLDIDGLANVRGQPVKLHVEITLNKSELEFLSYNVEHVAMLALQAEMAKPDSDNILSFTQFLSTPTGRDRVTTLASEAKIRIDGMTDSTILNLQLVMNGAEKSVYGVDVFSQQLLAVLDRGMPYQKSLFSYFPADRSFPQGEQPLQIGTADAQQQLLSYMGQPALKYARLKQVLIQNIILSPNGRQTLADEFKLIFDNLLPGKSLAGIEINQNGLMKVMVNDKNLNKTFDMDFMSSGEKGLLLTFLFLRLSMQNGGIVLIDEPELHLNSAVCDKILPFLVDHCVSPNNLQAFVCTHSPEIVRQAFERDDCSLYHLRSGRDLTPVLRQDQAEVFEIFHRLGTSPADVLFTKGGIYVEGEDDCVIIKSGFADLVAGYKLSALGGRGEIEREVPALQEEEKKGNLTKNQLFIMDGDRKPSNLKSTSMVKIRQLRRYCIENYLLNEEVIFDLIFAHGGNPVESRGQFPEILRDVAFQQILEIAASAAYDEIKPEGFGLRKDDLKDRSLDELAETLADRLSEVLTHLDGFERITWIANFKSLTEEKRGELQKLWSTSWKDQASGKTIIDDLYRRYSISMKKPEFKRAIIKRMAEEETDDWRVLRDLISSGLS